MISSTIANCVKLRFNFRRFEVLPFAFNFIYSSLYSKRISDGCGKVVRDISTKSREESVPIWFLINSHTCGVLRQKKNKVRTKNMPFKSTVSWYRCAGREHAVKKAVYWLGNTRTVARHQQCLKGKLVWKARSLKTWITTLLPEAYQTCTFSSCLRERQTVLEQLSKKKKYYTIVLLMNSATS